MPSSRTSGADTRTRLLNSAQHLFAERGYAAVSTKAICGAARANIAAIHYHFGSKEALYRRVLERFLTAAGMDRLSALLAPPSGREEFRLKLEMFLRFAAEGIAETPDLARIIRRDTEIMQAPTRRVFMATFYRIFLMIVAFMRAAKEKKLLRPSVDPFAAARFLDTQVSSQIHCGNVRSLLKMGNLADPAYRAKWASDTADLVLNGVLR